MSEYYIVPKASLDSVADAIRTKGETSAQLTFPQGFVDAINDIETWDGELVALLTNTLTSYSNSTITSIREYSFSGATALTSIDLPNVSSLGSYAFQNTRITEAVFPLVTTLGWCTFTGNSALRRAIFANLTSITGKQTFQNCTSLTEAYFPKLTTLPDTTFQNTKVPIFVFPAYSGGMGVNAFLGNTALTACDFKNCTNVQNGAFNGCTAFDTLIIRRTSGIATLANIGAFTNSPFASGNAGGTLYVPSALISSYQSATNWSTILGYENNSIVAIEGSIYETQYADGTPIAS